MTKEELVKLVKELLESSHLCIGQRPCGIVCEYVKLCKKVKKFLKEKG